MMNRPKFLVFPIHDGSGCSLEQENNTILMANTPCRNLLQKDYAMPSFDRSVHSTDKRCLTKIYLHAFFNDRDDPAKSAGTAIELFDEKLADQGVVLIASIAGRIYAMNRDNRRDRVKSAYGLISKGIDRFYADFAHTIRRLWPLAPVYYDLPPAMEAITGEVKSSEMTGRSLIVAA